MIYGQLTQTSAPQSLALDWAKDVRPGLRLDNDLEKEWVERLLVPAAAAWCEAITGRALITQTWVLRLPHFPPSGGRITLPKPPLQSITSISYVDANGVQQTWDMSLWRTENPPPAGEKAGHAHIWPAYGQSYPTTRIQPDAVTITFVCGYGDEASNIPAGLRTAMLLVIADRFEHREAAIKGAIETVPMGAEYLAGAYMAEAA